MLLHQDTRLVTIYVRHPITISQDVEFFLLRSQYFRDNSLNDGNFQAYILLFCSQSRIRTYKSYYLVLTSGDLFRTNVITQSSVFPVRHLTVNATFCPFQDSILPYELPTSPSYDTEGVSVRKSLEPLSLSSSFHVRTIIRCRRKGWLPTRRSFRLYCTFLELRDVLMFTTQRESSFRHSGI